MKTRECNAYEWIASGIGSGWLPKAPGTWGSIAALPPAWLIVEISGWAGLLAASIIITALGCFVCAKLTPSMKNKDPGWIVIDEWAGQWMCLSLSMYYMGNGWESYAAALIAFRIFDILKPWPISTMETIGPAWWSIMADDLGAGVAGAISITMLIKTGVI